MAATGPTAVHRGPVVTLNGSIPHGVSLKFEQNLSNCKTSNAICAFLIKIRQFFNPIRPNFPSNFNLFFNVCNFEVYLRHIFRALRVWSMPKSAGNKSCKEVSMVSFHWSKKFDHKNPTKKLTKNVFFIHSFLVGVFFIHSFLVDVFHPLIFPVCFFHPFVLWVFFSSIPVNKI